jgi:hypothetical protein
MLAFGGLALCLLAQLLFQYATFRRASRSRLLGVAVLVIFAVALRSSR